MDKVIASMIEVRRHPGGCGVEILGVDLRDLSDAEMQTIRQAYIDNGVIFFRDQALSEEDHIAFARRWGEIDVNKFFKADANHPEIAEVRKEKEQKTNIGGGWHTDHSYDEIPAMGSILVARQLPPQGGDTLFADMYAAYDALPDETKKEIENLDAVHSSVHVYGADGFYQKTDRGADLGGMNATGEAMHPVVITHPLSGRKALYVNPSFTIRFDGKTREESLPLLQKLFAHAMKPQFACRFQWKPGSIAFWDNRATWHFALNDYQGEERLMHRITVCGQPLH